MCVAHVGGVRFGNALAPLTYILPAHLHPYALRASRESCGLPPTARDKPKEVPLVDSREDRTPDLPRVRRT